LTRGCATHGGDGFVGAVRGEFGAQMRVPQVVDVLLIGG
jgi:hypothetical protein